MRHSSVTSRMDPQLGAYVIYLNVSILFGNMKGTGCDLVLTIILSTEYQNPDHPCHGRTNGEKEPKCGPSYNLS